MDFHELPDRNERGMKRWKLLALVIPLSALVVVVMQRAGPFETTIFKSTNSLVESLFTNNLIGFSESDDAAPVYAQHPVTETPDTVPKDVQCKKIQYCDRHNICAIVCERG